MSKSSQNILKSFPKTLFSLVCFLIALPCFFHIRICSLSIDVRKENYSKKGLNVSKLKLIHRMPTMINKFYHAVDQIKMKIRMQYDGFLHWSYLRLFNRY